ncbi:MAG: hypothetical protein IJR95_06990 [Lachnospiraceae bacterium]|nr:hypothetical protein [Lachnospiraceae bacterium]
MAQIDACIEYAKEHPEVREVLISGGDPPGDERRSLSLEPKGLARTERGCCKEE